MAQGLKLNKILIYFVLAVAGLFLVVFLLDLCVKIPFGRIDLWTDIFVVLSTSLIIWQATETLFEFRKRG